MAATNVSATSQNSSVNPTSTDPTTAGAVAQSNADGAVTGNTKFNSMEDLRKKSPKLYNMMMQGIAWNIIKEMDHHQERLKKMWKEMNRE